MNLKNFFKKKIVVKTKTHEEIYHEIHKDSVHSVDTFLKKIEEENNLYINEKSVKERVLNVTKYLKCVSGIITNNYINDKKTGASIKVIINNKINDLGINCEYIKFDFDFMLATICIDIDLSVIYISPTENQLNFEYNRKYLLLLCMYENEIINSVKEYYEVNNIDIHKCQEFNVIANKILNKKKFII